MYLTNVHFTLKINTTDWINLLRAYLNLMILNVIILDALLLLFWTPLSSFQHDQLKCTIV